MGSIVKPKKPSGPSAAELAAVQRQEEEQAQRLQEQREEQQREEERLLRLRRRGGLPQTVTTSATGVRRDPDAQPTRKSLLGE